MVKISESEKSQIKLDSLIERLPEFCFDFFVSTATTHTKATQIKYAYDFELFFKFLIDYKNIDEVTIDTLREVSVKDIERFIYYLTEYVNEDGVTVKNGEASLSNKLAAIRTLFAYLFSAGEIKDNPALLVKKPKIRQKDITVLEPDEAAKAIDKIEDGSNLSKRQKAFCEKTQRRDIAIFILLLSTGIRVSECVGINLEDINFDAAEIKIIRKGMKEQIIYLSNEAIVALQEYINNERPGLLGDSTDHALFISLKHGRMSARSVERIVSKYTADITSKHITPHKLRSTFGTALYNETGDIYLTSNALGHSSVNITAKYYSRMNREKLRAVKDIVKVRED